MGSALPDNFFPDLLSDSGLRRQKLPTFDSEEHSLRPLASQMYFNGKVTHEGYGADEQLHCKNEHVQRHPLSCTCFSDMDKDLNPISQASTPGRTTTTNKTSPSTPSTTPHLWWWSPGKRGPHRLDGLPRGMSRSSRTLSLWQGRLRARRRLHLNRQLVGPGALGRGMGGVGGRKDAYLKMKGRFNFWGQQKGHQLS